MKPRKILFRVDASEQIGAGHIVRCISLAEAFRSRGWHCEFASCPGTMSAAPRSDSAPFEVLTVPNDGTGDEKSFTSALGTEYDAVVFDHYGISANLESTYRAVAKNLLVIDDQPKREHDADILVDATLGRSAAEYADLVPTSCKIFTGPMYALIRGSFQAFRWAPTEQDNQNVADRVFVSMGATDPMDLTSIVIGALERCATDIQFDVVLGPSAPYLERVRKRIENGSLQAMLYVNPADIASLMATANIGIGTAGSSSWERCVLGLPSLIMCVAENQIDIGAALSNRGAAVNLGWYEDIEAGKIADAFHQLVNNHWSRNRMGRAAAKICDGLGATRIVNEMTN